MLWNWRMHCIGIHNLKPILGINSEWWSSDSIPLWTLMDWFIQFLQIMDLRKLFHSFWCFNGREETMLLFVESPKLNNSFTNSRCGLLECWLFSLEKFVLSHRKWIIASTWSVISSWQIAYQTFHCWYCSWLVLEMWHIWTVCSVVIALFISFQFFEEYYLYVAKELRTKTFFQFHLPWLHLCNVCCNWEINS